MLSIGIDPVLVSLGPFTVRWYGLMVAAAVIVGIFVGGREARRRGINEDEVYNLALWVVLAGVIGARLFHVVDKLSYYLSNPWAALALQEGGLSIYGAVVGGLLVAAVYSWRRRLPMRRLADAMAPALILAQATGRIGCVINGDAQGAPTSLPWGLSYTHPNTLAPVLGVPGHHYPVYEILWDLLVFGALWRLRGKLAPDGMLFLVYVSLYSFGRFFLTFVRQEQVVLLGMQQAQVVALACLLVAVPLMVLLSRSQHSTRPAPGQLDA